MKVFFSQRVPASWLVGAQVLESWLEAKHRTLVGHLKLGHAWYIVYCRWQYHFPQLLIVYVAAFEASSSGNYNLQQFAEPADSSAVLGITATLCCLGIAMVSATDTNVAVQLSCLDEDAMRSR